MMTAVPWFLLVLTVLYFAGLAVGHALAFWGSRIEEVDRRELVTAVEKADAIPRALEAWRADNGGYPLELRALVPDYLDEIPPVPFGDADAWRYDADAREVIAWVEDVPPEDLPAMYHLYARFERTHPLDVAYLGGVLVYRSDTRYPYRAYGGDLLERIDGWAYYHE